MATEFSKTTNIIRNTNMKVGSFARGFKVFVDSGICLKIVDPCIYPFVPACVGKCLYVHLLYDKMLQGTKYVLSSK